MSSFKPQYPLVVIQVDETRIAGVKLEREGVRLRLDSFAIQPAQEGTFEISMIKPNIRKMSAAMDGVKSVINELKPDGRALSLLLPDKTVKISLLPFQQLPPKRKDALNLIQWKLKKKIPFRVEDAIVDYNRIDGANPGRQGEQALLVATAQRAVLAQYEELFAQLGYHVGLVDISSFNLFNFYHDAIMKDVGTHGDAMMINVDDSCFTLSLYMGGAPALFRTKGTGQSEPTDRLVEAIVSEVQPSLLFYRDRLQGGGIRKAYFKGAREVFRRLEPEFADRFPLGTEWVNPVRILGRDALPAIDPDQLQVFSPLIGLAMGR